MGPEGKDVDPDYVRDILRYFLENPRAVDDLEGIAHWRLLDQRIQDTVTKVRLAVNWLASEGLLVTEPARTSSPMYRLNPERHVEIEKLVKKLSE